MDRSSRKLANAVVMAAIGIGLALLALSNGNGVMAAIALLYVLVGVPYYYANVTV